MTTKGMQLHRPVHEGGRAKYVRQARTVSDATKQQVPPASRHLSQRPIAADAGPPEDDPLPAVAERFLTVAEVLTLTSWSRSTLYRSIRKSRFPKPRVLSANRIGFLLSEVSTWVGSRHERNSG